jgi:hypothetical protein
MAMQIRAARAEQRGRKGAESEEEPERRAESQQSGDRAACQEASDMTGISYDTGGYLWSCINVQAIWPGFGEKSALRDPWLVWLIVLVKRFADISTFAVR